MDRSRASRIGALLASLLVGAVLLMHGLDAGAHDPIGSMSGPEHATHGAHSAHDPLGARPNGDCAECGDAHRAVTVCVAVAATALGVRAAHRLVSAGRIHAVRVAGNLASGAERLSEVASPRDPAWVRLAVMRC